MKHTKHMTALKEIYSKTTTITVVHCLSSIFLIMLLIQLTEQMNFVGVLVILIVMFLNNKFCSILHREGE